MRREKIDTEDDPQTAVGVQYVSMDWESDKGLKLKSKSSTAGVLQYKDQVVEMSAPRAA